MSGGLILLVGASGYCEELAAQETKKKGPHHLYFGLEFLNVSLSSKIHDVKVEGSKFYWGTGLGYEYRKPWAFYAGIDTISTSTNGDYRAYQNDVRVSTGNNPSFFDNLDLRLGYTLFPSNVSISPFLGIGTYFIRTFARDQGFLEIIPYLSGGLRTIFPITNLFDLGMNCKLYRAGQSEKLYFDDTSVKHMKDIWGGEIGIPLIFYFSATRTWDFQIEPYYLRLDFAEKQNVYGTHLLFGCHF